MYQKKPANMVEKKYIPYMVNWEKKNPLQVYIKDFVHRYRVTL